ncbi:MAG: GTPase ObgE [bacterium]
MSARRMAMFVDYTKIHVRAGDGGDGCISFLREKYVAHGGPNGGDGGRGGHIYLAADAQMTTLLDLKMRPHFTTRRGQHGGGSNCSGRDAEDLIIKAPLGTTVSDENGELLADMTVTGQIFLAARGGRGGRGNQHFASARNKAPRKFEYGEDGEQRALILELKIIADVGLIGLPNAGKSTLLSKLTAATPKIAAYPFTTIHPNLGVMELDDGRRCTIADIPGLIEGAHKGAGLGDRFLRHIERTRILVHLVAPPDAESQADPEYFLDSYELVNSELHAYGTELPRKPQIVCMTKTDLLTGQQILRVVRAFQERGLKLITISAHAGEGLEKLKNSIQALLLETIPADDRWE